MTWYLMRATGFVSLILLTTTLGLGVSNVARLATRSWTRTLAGLVHRNISLLAVIFLTIHIVTAVCDKYVRISLMSIIVPGLSNYDPLWIGLGAASLDLVIAVILTSLIRGRLPARVWKAVHWLAYLSWPAALVHAIGTGTGTGADTGRSWSTLIYLGCSAVFVLAVAARIAMSRRPPTIEPPIRYPLTVGTPS